MKYYVVSDLHGFYRKVKNKLKSNGFSIDNPDSKIIICGDAFDRGPDNIEMQNFLLELMEKDKLIYIRGNHEDLAIELINNANYYLRSKSFAKKSHMFANSTIDTFIELTGMSLDEIVSNPKKFVALARKTPYVSKLIPSTIDYYETKKHVFVHGWIPCKIINSHRRGSLYFYNPDWRDASKKEWELARWTTGIDAWAQNCIEDEKTIVCGHYYCSYGHYKYGKSKTEFGKHANFSPFIRKGITAIDACTAYSGKMNCIVIEE